jgi:hypothetical protein
MTNVLCRVGDYPGLGEATSMAHAGGRACHWCNVQFPWCNAMQRHDHRSARRFTDHGHACRGAGVWGDAEPRAVPTMRTHAGIIRDGLASARSDLPWNNDEHPRYRSGVDGECPLAKVPLFDLVWDVCMDFMHIVKVLMAGHMVPLMKGLRGLKPPKVKANVALDPAVARYPARAVSIVCCARPVITAYDRLCLVTTIPARS